MSRRRIIYLAVLGVSIVAFLVDRFMIGPPASASAADSQGDGSTATAQVPPAPPTEGGSTSVDATAANWLETLPEAEPMRDAFALAGELLARHRQRQNEVQRRQQGDQASIQEVLATFAGKHELQSTVIGRTRSLAMVDGQMLHVGSRLEEFELIRIVPSRAVFRYRDTDHEVELTLSLPGQ